MRFCRTAMLTAATLALGATGCDTTPTNPGTEQARRVADAEMQIRLPDGSNLSVIDWDITGGPSMVARSGMVNVGNSATIRFRVGGLPVGPGYHIELEGTSSTGTACAGEADFAIVGNQVTQVMMTLVCGDGVDDVDNDGDLDLRVNVEQNDGCPVITAITALPLEVFVGSSLSLSAASTSPTASYAWSGMGGTFSSAATAATSFTCTAAGDHVLAIAITEGTCTDDWSVTVTCTPVAGMAVCGNGAVETGEACDDMNTMTEACAYGLMSCTVCSATCQSVPGSTSFCGDGILNGPEECDGTAGCLADCTSPDPICGNGAVETGEGCDDMNTVTEACAYGLMSCTVCSATCQSVAGATAFCGDTIVNGAEACDGTAGCNPDCTMGGGPSACDTCRVEQCDDYQGVNWVLGCFDSGPAGNAAREVGGVTLSPAQVQTCVDAIACADEEQCAYNAANPFNPCYCGIGTTVDSCNNPANAATGPCVMEWEAMAGSTVRGDVMLAASNIELPSGWAYFLLECSRLRCASSCITP